MPFNRLLQFPIHHMRIDRSRLRAFVIQGPLDQPQVAGLAQQAGGESVPQAVRVHRLADDDQITPDLDDAPQLAIAEGPVVVVETCSCVFGPMCFQRATVALAAGLQLIVEEALAPYSADGPGLEKTGPGRKPLRCASMLQDGVPQECLSCAVLRRDGAGGGPAREPGPAD